VRLVDGRGRPLDLDTALLAFVDLVTEVDPGATVAVPVSTSRCVEDLVTSRGGDVRWTRVSSSALFAAAEEPGVGFAGAEGGGYAFPAFLPAYDGVMSLVKLLELLARTDSTLEEVVDRLPAPAVARIDVATPWEARGAVMRRLVERLDGDRTVTIDGVKVYRGRDWGLIVPHPQEPVIRVWAEAEDRASSLELAQEFADRVEELRA
ncbi:MAG TPA: mannose-1-phosphate guanyltransferase, partial [Actinomycetota bacterium]|nr:mannose-1-phosphate guanyltransferase [Actinomycetota bacterium]